MAQFKNAYASHEHSLEVLNMLYTYDSFLDSLTVIADMGCGLGLDSQWWATLMTRDEPSEPRNYIVYAVDQDVTQIDPDIEALENVYPMQGNFEDPILPRKADLVWAHDSFQFAQNPLKCLRNWRDSMNINGMLVMAVPQTTYMDHNRLIVSNHHNQYYSYNLLNLMYMLAMSGFDCRDAYFYRKPNTPWLYAGVYATEVDTLPAQATWYDLADRNLINASVVASLNRYGYARLEDVVVAWFDKDWYTIRD